MIHTEVPLAILPGGTANVLAHELKMKGGFTKQVAALPSLIPCRISVGRLRTQDSERYFLLMAGVGLDAQIVYELNLDLKAAVGKLAYYVGGFSQVFRTLPQFDVNVNGKERRCGFALVSRVRNYGGDLEIARGASLLRQDFEVVLFEGENSLGYLLYLAGVVIGKANKLTGVSVLRAHSLTCSHPTDARIHTQIDGELAAHLPVSIEIVPEALTLLLPSAYLKKEQTLPLAETYV
jgi:diacylglycerol kinase family enzyme